MSRLFSPLLLLLLVFAAFACKQSGETDALVEAHHLSYKVEYRDRMAGDIPTNILPKTLEAYYTRHHVCTTISGFLNQFILVQIADLRKRKVSTLLTFFGTKVYYEGQPGEIPAGIADPGELHFDFTGDTLRIGGMLSERIRVTTSPGKSFDIYSTEDFNSRRPNLCTPYHKVHDPLTRFSIKLSYLDMELICSEYQREEVDASIFEIPPDFKAVNRNAMESIINNLFTKE